MVLNLKELLHQGEEGKGAVSDTPGCDEGGALSNTSFLKKKIQILRNSSDFNGFRESLDNY